MLKRSLLVVVSTVALTVTAVLGLSPQTGSAQDGGGIPTLPADHPYAAFIDTYNAAIRAGATAEWRKMEGVALDAANNRLYIAVTSIGKGMSDTEGDMQLTENLCGAVYGADLDTDFNIAALTPIVAGGPYDEANGDYPCNADSIAGADNIFVDPSGNVWIGEDTGEHANNFLWVWNGTELKRFASVPAGAEVTGLRIEPDGTVFMNVQHPDATNPYPYNRGLIGVIKGFKAGDNFESLPVPTGDDVNKVMVAAGEYQVIARVGEAIPGDVEGNVYGAITTPNNELLYVCNDPDGNMFLPTTSAGDEGYLYTNYECGGAGKLYIRRDADGNWSAVEGEMVDFAPAGGTWSNCNASVTPWNTGLSSEEYPPDNEEDWAYWQEVADDFNASIGGTGNPFNIGYIVELIPQSVGTEVVKHYAMGRFSKEMTLVMPDSKTAYFGDDGTDRVLYKFVADNAGDLSAGTLYAAKITQDGETLNVEWIALGSGNDAEIGAAIAELQPE